MKIIRICLSLLFLSFFISCSNEDIKEKEVNPIELSKRVAVVDDVNPKDSIEILEGNGGYKISVKGYNIDKEFENIPFENHTRVYVEGNKIIAERILLKDFLLIATFVLTDSEGVKKTFVIQNSNLLGIHHFFD